MNRCNVSEGQLVMTGDVLCEFTSNDGLSEGRLLEAQLLTDIGERRSALKKQREAVDLKYDQELRLLAETQTAQLEDLELLKNETEALEARLQIAEQQRNQGRRLVQSGALSETALTELEDRFYSRTADFANARRAVEKTESSLRSHSAQVARLESARGEALATIEEELQSINMEETQLQASKALRILAPRSGQVASIRARAGASVSPGDPLLDIIPVERSLQAKLYANPAVMNNIKPGQTVRVYIDALPYERHGAQLGIVHTISRTSFTSQMAGPRPAYRILVTFPEGFDLPPETVQMLRPGMTVAADLILDHATMLDWLVDPLRRGAERV